MLMICHVNENIWCAKTAEQNTEITVKMQNVRRVASNR